MRPSTFIYFWAGALALLPFANAFSANSQHGTIFRKRQSGSVQFPSECLPAICGAIQEAANCGTSECICSAQVQDSLVVCQECLTEAQREQESEIILGSSASDTTPTDGTPDVEIPNLALFQCTSSSSSTSSGNSDAGSAGSAASPESGSSGAGSGSSTPGTTDGGSLNAKNSAKNLDFHLGQGSLIIIAVMSLVYSL